MGHGQPPRPRTVPRLNNKPGLIFLFKESSVVSAIALADVMYMAKDLIGMYYSTYESLFMLVVAYLVILLPISIFGTWLERRFDYERR